MVDETVRYGDIVVIYHGDLVTFKFINGIELTCSLERAIDALIYLAKEDKPEPE